MSTITANYRERTRESKAQYQEYKMRDEKNSKEIREATIYINRITVNSSERFRILSNETTSLGQNQWYESSNRCTRSESSSSND